MDNLEAYKKTKADAKRIGLIIGGVWVLSFACYIANFHFQFFEVVWMLLAIYPVMFICLRLYAIQRQWYEGRMSLIHAFSYSIQCGFYGSLILAACMFVYFQFIDHGFLFEQYSKLFSSKIMTDVLANWEKEGFMSAKEFHEAIEQMRSLRPIDITMQVLFTNIIVMFVVSPFLAFSTIFTRKRR